ncbi:MAG TPA: SAM-dependent methyltransferase [Dongiaceae bacterium]|nr:SAM-dependent methyltransferase [Dongiaceae bacterium]
MRAALLGTQGYYRTDPNIGQDFTTAPEISQMFGELLGLWCVDSWERLGRPSPFLLVELGPGRGTLLSDALRAARKYPGFLQALRLHLVEISPALRAQQQRVLDKFPIEWHAEYGTLPAGPMILLANEFFDCLPIHQFMRTDTEWQEIGIVEDGRPTPVRLPPGPQLALARHKHERRFVEISPAALSLAHELGQRVKQVPSVALIIDYGYGEEDHGNTLQAMKGGQRYKPWDAPPGCDLTAHVDFPALRQAAIEAGANCFGPLPQGAFLRRLGIEERARQLGQEHERRRLCDPTEMGVLFKVMAITSPSLSSLAGFDNA